jgi:hypothetical protein
MNYFKLITHLSLILLFTFSCKTLQNNKALEVKENADVEKSLDLSFETDNKKFDSSYIKSGCQIINSNKPIHDNFTYINFLHNYLKFKSYGQEYLKYSDCRQKLEDATLYLLVMDRRSAKILEA